MMTMCKALNISLAKMTRILSNQQTKQTSRKLKLTVAQELLHPHYLWNDTQVPALSRSLSAEAMVSMVIPQERGNRKSQKEKKKNRSTYAIPYYEI